MTDDEWDKLTRDFDYARWTITCRMMMSRIVQGQMEGAHQALRYFCRQPRRVLTTAQSHVALAFPVRTANALEEAGYVDVESVRLASDDELASIPNVSRKAVEELRRTIAKILDGEHFEVYCEDDEKLIDAELSVSSLPASRVTVRSSPETGLITQGSRDHAPKESRTMTNEEQVIQALELLVQSPDTVNEAVDKQIAVLESEIEKRKTEIARLKKMQRSFGLVEKKVGKSAGGKQSKRDAIEEKIFVYVKANGPTGVATIAKHLDMMPTVVGKTVSGSSRLAKDPATNRVVIRTEG